MQDRQPLTRARIVDAAAQVADDGGLAAVSMRSVARALGVEAMSLYHHVSSKDALLDALADWAYAQIELPSATAPWRAGLREHVRSARHVLAAHPWTLQLVDSRADPGPSIMRRLDALIGCLRRGGFSIALASHAASVVDAYVYGFVLTERNLPFDPAAGAQEFTENVDIPGDDYPHLAELVGELTRGGDYSFSAEFEIGLEIILDALERRVLDDE